MEGAASPVAGEPGRTATLPPDWSPRFLRWGDEEGLLQLLQTVFGA